MDEPHSLNVIWMKQPILPDSKHSRFRSAAASIVRLLYRVRALHGTFPKRRDSVCEARIMHFRFTHFRLSLSLVRVLPLACLAITLAGCGSSASAPPLPKGWQSVAKDGVAIYVPASWAVTSEAGAACGAQVPTVILLNKPSYTCAADQSYRAFPSVVVFSELGAPIIGTSRRFITRTINGVACSIFRRMYTLTDLPLNQSHSTNSVPNIRHLSFTDYIVRIASDHLSINVNVGNTDLCAGGAKGRALAIVNSIHSAPSP
jgi:hypothetical protein